MSRKQPFQEISKISCLLKSHIKMVIIDMLCPQRNRGSCLRTIHHFFFQEAVIGIESSMNLIVIHTLPGSAQSVAAAIDQTRYSEIMGTLAGDDTILLIMRNPDDVELFKKKIQELLKA